MSSKKTKMQPESQATPLAEELLGLLESQITGGQFGQGVGPLQREAGTAARQFVNSGGMALPPQLEQAMQERQAQGREQAMADLGEQFGIAGAQTGSPLAFGSSQLLSELIPRQTEELFNQRRAFNQQQLQGIELLQTIGNQNIAPFMEMARMGILPEEIIVEENPWIKGLKTIGGIAGNVIGDQGLFGGDEPGGFQGGRRPGRGVPGRTGGRGFPGGPGTDRGAPFA